MIFIGYSIPFDGKRFMPTVYFFLNEEYETEVLCSPLTLNILWSPQLQKVPQIENSLLVAKGEGVWEREGLADWG